MEAGAEEFGLERVGGEEEPEGFSGGGDTAGEGVEGGTAANAQTRSTSRKNSKCTTSTANR